MTLGTFVLRDCGSSGRRGGRGGLRRYGDGCHDRPALFADAVGRFNWFFAVRTYVYATGSDWRSSDSRDRGGCYDGRREDSAAVLTNVISGRDGLMTVWTVRRSHKFSLKQSLVPNLLL